MSIWECRDCVCVQGGQDKITSGQGSGGERLRILHPVLPHPAPCSSEGAFLLQALTHALRAHKCDVNVDLWVQTAACVYMSEQGYHCVVCNQSMISFPTVSYDYWLARTGNGRLESLSSHLSALGQTPVGKKEASSLGSSGSLEQDFMSCLGETAG